MSFKEQICIINACSLCRCEERARIPAVLNILAQLLRGRGMLSSVHEMEFPRTSALRSNDKTFPALL